MLVRWSNTNSLLVWMQNGTAILEDSLAASYKTEHSLIMQSRNYGPWYLPKEVENLWSHKCLHMYVDSSFTYICLKSETTRCPSVSEWVNGRIRIVECCMCVLSCSFTSDSLQPYRLCPPGSSVHRIFPARILEWVAIYPSRSGM